MRIFFNSWSDVGRVAAATAVVFACVVLILRVVGSTALARMSGYDMVATVTLGSVVATVALTRSITVSDGVALLVTLVALQSVVRHFQSRWLFAHHAVREPPIVVVWDGQLLEDALKEHSISADEVRAALRKEGLASFSDARIVVLENDGDWSVVRKSQEHGDETAFYGLPIPGRHGEGSQRSRDHAEPASPERLP